MTWDGAPNGWVPPAEQRAANEAAEKFAAERAAADDRTRVLADAIAFGLDRIALAIVAAAGDNASARYVHLQDAGLVDDKPDDDTGTFGTGAFTSADFAEPRRPPVDPDLDDLLGDEDHDPNG